MSASATDTRNAMLDAALRYARQVRPVFPCKPASKAPLAWIGVKKHLTELLEEAADVGSWSALAEQALDLDLVLSEQHRQQIRAVLRTAARHGAQAHESLTIALDSLSATSSKAAA